LFFCFSSLSAQDFSSTEIKEQEIAVTALDISGLISLQYKAIEKFQQSLPYMQKAQELKPEDEDIVFALASIYYALSEEEEYAKCMEMYEALAKTGVPE